MIYVATPCVFIHIVAINSVPGFVGVGGSVRAVIPRFAERLQDFCFALIQKNLASRQSLHVGTIEFAKLTVAQAGGSKVQSPALAPLVSFLSLSLALILFPDVSVTPSFLSAGDSPSSIGDFLFFPLFVLARGGDST